MVAIIPDDPAIILLTIPFYIFRITILFWRAPRNDVVVQLYGGDTKGAPKKALFPNRNSL
jgi:hypothetical protein